MWCCFSFSWWKCFREAKSRLKVSAIELLGASGLLLLMMMMVLVMMMNRRSKWWKGAAYREKVLCSLSVRTVTGDAGLFILFRRRRRRWNKLMRRRQRHFQQKHTQFENCAGTFLFGKLFVQQGTITAAAAEGALVALTNSLNWLPSVRQPNCLCVFRRENAAANTESVWTASSSDAQCICTLFNSLVSDDEVSDEMRWDGCRESCCNRSLAPSMLREESRVLQ